jgi:hypothetical protein
MNMAVLSFLRLEDFVEEVKADCPVRVESISRTIPSKQPGGDLVEWYVLVTTKADDDIVMFSIRVGRCLSIFAKNEPHHVVNAKRAEQLIKDHLESEGLEVRPGTWEPYTVMENLSDGSAGLWHFEDKRLVSNVGTDKNGKQGSGEHG